MSVNPSLRILQLHEISATLLLCKSYKLMTYTDRGLQICNIFWFRPTDWLISSVLQYRVEDVLESVGVDLWLSSLLLRERRPTCWLTTETEVSQTTDSREHLTLVTQISLFFFTKIKIILQKDFHCSLLRRLSANNSSDVSRPSWKSMNLHPQYFILQTSNISL